MTDSECVITGCWLRMAATGAAVWGDLHRTRDAWVFVACVDRGGAVAWHAQADKPTSWIEHRYILLLDDRPCFESRGVFVFSKPRAELSDAAKEYLKGGFRPRLV